MTVYLAWTPELPEEDLPGGATPKLRGLNPGTLTWLRERTPRP